MACRIYARPPSSSGFWWFMEGRHRSQKSLSLGSWPQTPDDRLLPSLPPTDWEWECKTLFRIYTGKFKTGIPSGGWVWSNLGGGCTKRVFWKLRNTTPSGSSWPACLFFLVLPSASVCPNIISKSLPVRYLSGSHSCNEIVFIVKTHRQNEQLQSTFGGVFALGQFWCSRQHSDK